MSDENPNSKAGSIMKKQPLIIMLALLAGIPLAGAQTLIPLYSFTALDVNGFNNDGAQPFSGLVQASDGNLYGTASDGGANGNGTVFRITTSGVLTPLYSFTAVDLNGYNNDGANPWAGLMQANDGNLYGMASDGGADSDGTVFRITTNGAFTPLHSFIYDSDGGDPLGGLVQASDGNLYGTAEHGGTNIERDGTVFRFTTTGVFTPLYSFTDGYDGGEPYGALVQANDGNLYGTTTDGGTNGQGAVFRITTAGVFTPLYSFTGGNDGANPFGSLVQASDGNLYGTTSYAGGPDHAGTIFRITTHGILTTLYSFTDDNDGAYPYGGLVQANDGNLYGMASVGGADNDGTVFRITTNGVFTPLYSFTGGNDGAQPQAGLVQANDGNLYGTTEAGGASGNGTVFEFTVSPPPLNILSAGNQIVLSWPGWAGNYVLQSTTNLASPNWVTVSNAISGMAVTNSSPAQYFRLMSP
jgi:uncharacterized repeat protein (TIGR03803 family)